MTNRMRRAAEGTILCGILMMPAVVVMAAATPASQAKGRGRILIVADEPEPMKALAEVLRKEGRYQTKYVGQKLLPQDLSDYAAVFMYIHGRMTRRTEKALIDYANGGGRLIILHHGIASARMANPDWLRLTGMHIAPRNDPKHPWKVVGNTTHTLVNLQPRHYITSHRVTYDRMVEYRSSDSPSRPGKYPALDLKNTEVFLNQHFTDGRRKTVLFGFRVVTAAGETIMQDRSGWYKPSGSGWVFYLQPGHSVSDFKNRSYSQIILNCLSWQPKPPTKGPKTEIVMGFAMVGSESDWRAAHTVSITTEAMRRGIDLRFAEGLREQESQIKALRSFVARKVDVIAFSPVVETGWEPVLREIKRAGIPVILTDRRVDVTDHSLYVTCIRPDMVEQGRKAARWFVKNTTGEVKVFELRGMPGVSVAIDRKKGFKEVIAKHRRITIIHSQAGNFERGKGKEVMEAFLKSPKGKEFNALFAHNDDMALGAIQAIKEAGLKPGKDIKIVSIDAIKAAFEAMIAGELNCTVEYSPLIGPQLFDFVEALIKKHIAIKEGVFDQSQAKEAIKTRKY